MPLHVRVIVNPAAGKAQPDVGTVNRVLQRSGVNWEMRVTTGRGSAERLTREAVEQGVDGVLVYGGDGTMMEAVTTLLGHSVPLGIIPGGSANALAVEVGIPRDVRTATRVACQSERTRSIDVGRLIDRGQPFVVRTGAGFEAQMVRMAARSEGPTGGLLGYWSVAPDALRQAPFSRYRLTLDGQVVETRGVQCAVTNVGNVSRRRIRLAPDIRVDDGLLDVVVWPTDSRWRLVELAARMATNRDLGDLVQHWQARSVRVEADPPQAIEVDGERCDTTPFEATIQPGAVSIIVPGGAARTE